MDFDRNRDGKLSQNELAVRYARRREGEEEARQAQRTDRRSGREETVEMPDVFNGRRSYRANGSRRLPEGLPGYFTDKDANGDGQVTMAEFSEEWSNAVVAEFFDSDFNRDGVITAAEALRKVEQGGAATQMASVTGATTSSASGKPTSSATPAGAPDEKYVKVVERIVGRYDKNKDKVLTPSEWDQMLMSPAEADSDRDGRITVTEYALWMQSRQKK